MSASSPALTLPPRADSEAADKLFWLSRIDQSLPRAQVVPDFKRPAAGRHRYRSVEFPLEPEVVRILKSLDKTQGVSDTVLCATLLAVVLAKYHREDELIIGLQARGTGSSASVVPLRLPCADGDTASSIMRAVTGEVASLLARAPCSAASMAQILGVELSENRSPFFDVALAVADGDAAIDCEAYPVDLAFLFDATEGLIRLRILYAEDLFQAATVERLGSHLLNAARQISARPAVGLAEIDVLAPEERRRILQDFAGRRRQFPLDRTLHGLFEEQARKTPGAAAAIDSVSTLTYDELDRRANRLAHTLLSLGLAKGQFVGILLHRSCDFVVSMLAVFKAGGAYVPLDPTYPRERILYMLDDSEAAIVISNGALVESFREVVSGAGQLRAIVSVDGPVDAARLSGSERRQPLAVAAPAALAAASDARPELSGAGTDRAYMIYTSGSTGQPKGAICRHDGALNHLYGELDGIGIDRAFRFAQTAASSSDISVWQFMAPLLFGGATVIVDYDVVVDPALLFQTIRDRQVTVAELVPVVLRALIDHIEARPPASRDLPDLRFMMATGDALAPELVERWLARYPNIPVANTYGPTETSDDVSLLVLRKPLAESRAVVPIGPALPNVHLLMLDRNLRLVPIGAPGEIVIGGIAVGEGYWRQPEKTAAAFVPCPYPEIGGGRVYRSGDLGRWLPDGSVEFLGRIDQQIKVRGFRVEPGEVESVLTRHPGVQDAAVIAVSDIAGNKRLVGFFVAREDGSPTAGDLRGYLGGVLADHMIPAALVPVRALPLTPLGKVDRKALGRSEYLRDVVGENYVPPRNETEKVIAAAWSKVLNLTWVGIHDNFFEIGGDSILTIHIVAELAEAGFRVAPKQIFLYPTVAELAAHLEPAKAAAGSPAAGAQGSSATEAPWNVAAVREQLAAAFPEIEDVYPLSATQRGIYFQSILAARGSGGYIEQIGFELRGNIDEGAFAKAWQAVVDATEVLRTAVVRRGVPQPMQVVCRSAALTPQIQDLRGLSAKDRDSALQAHIVAERQRGFDLGKPPLMRVTLTRLADQAWHVLWTYHHIILDGWSEPLVLADVFRAYDALAEGRQVSPVRARRYRDFVAWSEAQDFSRAERFWRQQLAGFVAPVRVEDASPEVAPPSSGEISHGEHEILLSEADTTRLEDVARRNRLTLSTVLHGAWGLLLHRRTGSADVVFGSVASGRQGELAQIESIRGVVVVTQPLRTRLVAEATASSWLRLLQLQMAEMREFEHTPLAQIQQWCEVPAEKRPLLDTLVVIANYTGSDLAACHPANTELSAVSYFTQPLYALTLFVTGGDRIGLRIVYDKRKYALSTVRGLVDDYRQLLIGFAENPEQRLGGMQLAR